MEDIKISIQNSIVNYLERLSYLAQEDDKLVKDLMLLIVVDNVSDWAEWMTKDADTLLYLLNFRRDIIRNNPKIENYKTPTNKYYKNVNSLQTVYTWQRGYDNPDSTTFDTL